MHSNISLHRRITIFFLALSLMLIYPTSNLKKSQLIKIMKVLYIVLQAQ
jgi:hypothetical protein